MGKKRKQLKDGAAPQLGELRSVLTHRRDSQGWALVRDWAEQAWRADALQFDEVWLPTLQSHLADWPAQVRDAPKRWLMQAMERDRFSPLRLARRIHLTEPGIFEQRQSPLPELATLPEAAEIALLHLNTSLSMRDIEAMHLPGAWPALRELLAEGYHTGESLEAVLRAPQLLALEGLSVGGIVDPGSPTRIPHAALPALRHLGAPRLQASSGLLWLDALLGETAAPALTSLDLRATRLVGRSADWERWLPLHASRLRAVNLTHATSVRHEDLLRAFGPNLETLELTGLRPEQALLDDDTLIGWLGGRAPHSPIKRLSLAHTELGARSLEALRERGALPTLVRLDLSGCRRVGVNAIAQLSRITHLTALRELNLRGCPLNDSAARWLTGWPLLPQLTLLDVRDATIERDHIGWLREAASPGLKLLHDDI